MGNKTIRISVRNLVEFIFRSGDIDNRRGQSFDKEAMLKGGALHRKLQGSRGPSYRAEVPVVYRKDFETFTLQIEGRADGVSLEKEQVWIEEIKGMYRDLSLMEEPFFVHQAQAMCYAYIYGTEQALEEVGIRMTYVNLDTEFTRVFEECKSLSDLRIWFEELLQEYYKWVNYRVSWERIRDASMVGLEFPFPYRKGQREIVTSVYRTFQQKKEIFIQAPTGIGKTLSTVYPAVRALGEKCGDRIFYLTAKTITRTVASEAFSILRERGLKLKSILLTAKEKLCVCEEMDCNPIACERAKGHFDRVNEAVFESLQQTSEFSREFILHQAELFNVCPFEFSLDLSLWVDAIICDYNYVFDPNVRLKRFFAEGTKGEYLFLIDEAHNLVERGRQMYSASLSKNEVLRLKRFLLDRYPGANRVIKGLEKLNKQLLELKRSCDTYHVFEHTGTVAMTCLNLLGAFDSWFEDTKDKQKETAILDFYFALRDYVSVGDLWDQNYVIYGRCDKEGDFLLKEFCVNPAANLQACINSGRGAVFFSATLLPLEYYIRLFSTRNDCYHMYVESPFSTENRLLVIGEDVSSKYTRRGFEEYYRIASYIQTICEKQPGNYMVFFPSYAMLKEVQEVYETHFLKEEQLVFQSNQMNEEEREIFLSLFQNTEGILLAFCVMGGIFSEGIDLIGEQLIGAILIGTGLPQVNDESEILKEFYDKKGEKGFNYAYRYPGMNKVLQAAGRVIRTTKDRGVICLLDERFMNSAYQKLFPREWFPHVRCNRGNIEGVVWEFWEKDIDTDSLGD